MNYKVSKHIDLNQQASWCPGCGHGIICRIITDAADKLGAGDRIVTADDVARTPWTTTPSWALTAVSSPPPPA